MWILQFSHSIMSDSLWPHGMKYARLPYPSPTPRSYSNSGPLSWWCHPTISSSIVPFSHLKLLPASGSFQRSQLFTSGGQSIEVSASASVLPINIQGWFLFGWTGWISLQSKGLSRVFSNTIVQKHLYKGGMFWENSIKTCILSSVKQITSPGWMHETCAWGWSTGMTQRDWRFRMGNTCKSMADSCQCMAKTTTIL